MAVVEGPPEFVTTSRKRRLSSNLLESKSFPGLALTSSEGTPGEDESCGFTQGSWKSDYVASEEGGDCMDDGNTQKCGITNCDKKCYVFTGVNGTDRDETLSDGEMSDRSRRVLTSGETVSNLCTEFEAEKRPQPDDTTGCGTNGSRENFATYVEYRNVGLHSWNHSGNDLSESSASSAELDDYSSDFTADGEAHSPLEPKCSYRCGTECQTKACDCAKSSNFSQNKNDYGRLKMGDCAGKQRDSLGGVGSDNWLNFGSTRMTSLEVLTQEDSGLSAVGLDEREGLTRNPRQAGEVSMSEDSKCGTSLKKCVSEYTSTYSNSGTIPPPISAPSSLTNRIASYTPSASQPESSQSEAKNFDKQNTCDDRASANRNADGISRNESVKLGGTRPSTETSEMNDHIYCVEEKLNKTFPNSVAYQLEDSAQSPNKNRRTRQSAQTNASRKKVEKNSPSSEKNRLAVFKVRTLWGMILLLLLSIFLSFGHFYCGILVLLVIFGIYHEVIGLKKIEEKDKRLPLFFILRWYWFLLTIWWIGVPWAIPRLTLLERTYTAPNLLHFLHLAGKHHSLISYSAAFFGFVIFILSLRSYTLRYQFRQLGIMFLTLFIVVAQSLMQIANIYRGLIWFFIPLTLVIVNDVTAYVFGSLFGRTKLIKISPKKTLEGFIGASLATVIWAGLLCCVLQKYKPFTCAQPEIDVRPAAFWWDLDCPASKTFELQEYLVPARLAPVWGSRTLTATPMQLHSIALGLFAAFFAPFGGFFASGFKRAVRIKDFGDYIPGHGGLTDRFDCQILMGMFTYVYLKSINSYHSTDTKMSRKLLHLVEVIGTLTLREKQILNEYLEASLQVSLLTDYEESPHTEPVCPFQANDEISPSNILK